MYVKTVKIKGIVKALVTVLIIAAVLFAMVYAANRLIKPKAVTLKTEQDMLDFLHKLGWETSENAINIRGVTIPSDWNDVYARYNDIQKQQGFDLTDYKGSDAMVYTFKIFNYEGQPDNVVANLLICGDKLVAADVSCTELGGFMQGIARAESADGVKAD